MPAPRSLLFGKMRIAVPHPSPGLVFRSILRVYLESLYASVRQPETFEDVRSYCMFVGYPRSGHSLLGSIIDAHPHAICSHELDALRLVEAGFSRRQIYSLILKNSAEFARHGRAWRFGYKYEIPGQWNGRFEKLLLIGDKKGGASAARFATTPNLLQTLRAVVGSRIKFLHVTRNPYDNIGSMVRRGMNLSIAVEQYFRRADAVVELSRRVDQRDFLTVSLEELAASPSQVVRGVCAFLELDPIAEYVDACCGVVNREPHRARTQAEWSEHFLTLVRERSIANPFLRHYTFD
jgi:hypothetical protein